MHTARDDDAALQPVLLERVRGHLTLFRFRDDLLLCFWHGPPSEAALHELVSAVDRLTKSHLRKFSLLHIVSTGMQSLDEQARSTFVRIMRDNGERLACIGVVLEGSGFWASLMQSATTGMRLLAGGSFKLCVDERVEGLAKRFALAHWAATNKPMSEEGLLALVEHARAEAAQDVA